MLKWLLVGAVTWQAHPEGTGARYLRALSMFTCLVQARALYEFFYNNGKQTGPGDTAYARHFATSWNPKPTELYSGYMANKAPAQKRVFHPVYGRSEYSGGTAADESDHLKNRVLGFAQDLKRLTDEFAAACDEKEHRELVECALAKALRDGHELAGQYDIPDPL
jgi:hypothetical protein